MKRVEGFIPLDDGLRLHYRSMGEGSEVVLVPSKASLADDLEQLADGRRIIFYDQRGRGKSDFDPDNSHIWFNYEVSDIEAIRNHFGLDKISLLGWSYNGAMTALYAAAYPDRVKRLIMMCPLSPRSDAPYRDSERITQIAEKRVDPQGEIHLQELREKGLDTSDPESYCREYMRINLPRQMGNPDKLAGMRSDPCQYANEWPENKANHTKLHVPPEALIWDWRQEAKSITAPTLIIHGEEDLIPLESSQEWRDLIPQACLISIGGSGHYPHLEAPGKFFEAVLDFLDSE